EDNKTPVITDKLPTEIAPSGDPHDYVSNTRYKMWRNEHGNLAWEDGVPNPEAYRYSDVKKVEEFKINVFCTSEAALEVVDNGEDPAKYAEYLNTALSRWFINEDTRMTPNLEYAQVINGEETGQYFGIIEGTDFLYVLDQIQKIQEKNIINPEVLTGIKDWYGSYLDWLTKSEKGIREMGKENNHGTWYDAQVAMIADFLGNRDKVIEAINRSKERIAGQITSAGDMPLEREDRVDSFGYFLYNLDAYTKIATVAEKYGEDCDLWNYTSENGGSLKKAFEFFATNIPDEQNHPIPSERSSQMYPALRAAAKAYNNSQYYSLPERYFPTKGLENKRDELANRLADEITR
ncbi:alginate lyase family protein, partial [Patescibacteria group bacterium]|nr:alginate lyase family protein [Patescibacteria group bacterium]